MSFTVKLLKKISARKKSLLILLCLGVSMAIIFYAYYSSIIKKRPFPQNGRVSPSGCYVTELCLMPQDEYFIINLFYQSPAFVKIFDANTKESLYTSKIYSLEFLSPVLEFDDKIRYGFLSINTECKKKFVPPEEFTPD